MKAATPEQIEEACMTRSATDAWRYLLSQNMKVSQSHCNVAIARLIESGRRGNLPGGGVGTTTSNTDTAVERANAAMGCKNLLRRQIETGHHWIHDPAQMADALRLAGMVPA